MPSIQASFLFYSKAVEMVANILTVNTEGNIVSEENSSFKFAISRGLDEKVGQTSTGKSFLLPLCTGNKFKFILCLYFLYF